MSNVIARPVIAQSEWEQFLAEHPEANFLQSWSWGDFHEALNNTIYRIGLYQDTTLVGVMLAVVDNAPDIRCLAVWGGPIIDWEDSAHVQAFTAEARRIAKVEKCAFIRVRPQLEATLSTTALFSGNRFIRAPRNLHAEWTSIVDVTQSEDRLLANMSQSTRAKIRKAQSLGIRVTTTSDSDSIARYCDIQRGTRSRKGFEPHSDEYYQKQFQTLSRSGNTLLYSAELAGEILAQAIIIFYGHEAVYHYGASTEAGRKYPGAYLLHWEAMQEAKRRGILRYNLWGIAPKDDESHRYAKISQFKRGFGGEDFEYVYARHFVVDHPGYLHNLVAGRLKKYRNEVLEWLGREDTRDESLWDLVRLLRGRQHINTSDAAA